MVLRFFKMIGHGTLMMVRMLRNYAMLSMSVVLSFSVLLGYLVYTDSTLFNQYKHVLFKPDGWTIVYDQQKSIGDILSLQKLTEGAAGGESYVMSQYEGSSLESLDHSYTYRFRVYTVPTVSWGLFLPHSIPEAVTVSWLDGRERDDVVLNKGEILISKQAYDVLFAGKTEAPVLPVAIPVRYSGNTHGNGWLDCKVVGTLDSPDYFSQGLAVSEHSASLLITVFMSQATADEIMQDGKADLHARWVIFNAGNPDAVIKAADQLGMLYNSVHEIKSNALREMQLHAQTKMIIVLLMFVLLGINLYGSFSNALERRRFEVGIKRAIGASKAAIIGQFMWESMLLMLCNIFVSVVIVFNLALWMKYFEEKTMNFNPYWNWTIYMSGTSILLFAVVTIALTLLFSVIFAVKATQVQVVEYLKAE